MTLPPLLDLMGIHDAAIQAVVAKADRMQSGWSEAAFDLLVLYLAQNAGQMFKADDIRVFAYENGLPRPHDDRAWGAVIQKAAKRKLIKRSGYAPTSALGAHHRPVTIWKAA